MARFIFPSLSRPDIGYSAGESVDWNSYHMDERYRIDSWCGEFKTYGDGLTQHSTEYCAMKENMADYLASLAEWLYDHPDDVEDVASRFGHTFFSTNMRFYAGIKYHDDKRQWYNVAEQKVTTSASKQHDKRWLEVPEWANGSATAVFRLVCQDYWSNLTKYAFANDLSDMADRKDVDFYVCYTFASSVCGFCGKDETVDGCVPIDTAALRYAYRAIMAICDAYRNRLSVQTNLRNYKNRACKELALAE